MRVSKARGYLLCGMILAAGALLFVGSNALAQPPMPGPEEITITTYYPAPYGVYRKMETSVLRLAPSGGQPIPSGEEEEGMIYFDDGTGRTKGYYYWDSSVSDWVALGGGGNGDGAGHSVKSSQQQITGMDTPVQVFEQDLFGLISASSFPPFQKVLVLFTAPFAKTASGGYAYIRIYINGALKRTLYIRPDSTIGQQVAPVAFHHLEVGSMPSINVQVRWQGSGIIQPGASWSPRILSVLATD